MSVKREPQRARCTALTADGTPCNGWAMHGATLCVAHLGMNGRKTSLDAQLVDNLVVMLRAGNYLPVALHAVGLPRATFYEWMARGEQGGAGNVYSDMRERVMQARAEGEVRLVAQIARAAQDTWQAAGWLLERQYPERWGRVSVRLRDPQVEDDNDAADVVHDDPFAEVDELAAARRRRIGA